MRNKAYVGALRGEGDYLLLVTLRNAEEVISARDLPQPAGRAPTQKEIAMAKQLVGLLEGEFNAADYKDEYRERVMQFIERKAKGKKPRLQTVKTEAKGRIAGRGAREEPAVIEKGETRCLNEPQREPQKSTRLTAMADCARSGQARLRSDSSVCPSICFRPIAAVAPLRMPSPRANRCRASTTTRKLSATSMLMKWCGDMKSRRASMWS